MIDSKYTIAECINCHKKVIVKKGTYKKNFLCNDCKIEKFGSICVVCGKKFIRRHAICCSNECSNYYKTHRTQFLSNDALCRLSEAGKKSSNKQSEIRRSKNEIEFCKLCESYFDNVTHNEPIFNGWDADVLIYDKKIAILWNGPWHYKKITKKHSVKQVQNRDNIKINEIIKAGWIPYIIKDMGKHNENFVKEKFDEFIEKMNV